MQKAVNINLDETVDNLEENIEPHLLPENTILLYKLRDEKQLPPKPPPTPKEFISDCYATVLPKYPETVSNIEIPYVREVGVRDAIGMLAPYFSCNDYKNNLVQFWFLDILVDCIWKAQDEFRLSIQQQKCVLEWMLFILKLIGTSNMTKAMMFQIFNDAMAIAEEYVQSGGLEQPLPSKLFTVDLEINSGDGSSISTLHSSSILDPKSKSSVAFKPSKQYVVISCNEECQVYKLPTKQMTVDCLLSSVDSASDYQIQDEESVEAISEEGSESSVDFCKVDMSTPPRFKSLQVLNKSPSIESTLDDPKYHQDSSRMIGDWHQIPRKRSLPLCPSKTISERNNLPVIEEKVDENEGEKMLHSQILQDQSSSADHEDPEPTAEETFKAFYEYNRWKLKTDFMDSSQIGWVSLSSNKSIHSHSVLSKHIPEFDFKKRLAEDERDLFIKSCILMAIKQIVFDYFEQDFSFELARISLINPQFLITQDINIEWNIPKEIKGEIKKPMPKKPKKEKSKKEPKSKSKKDKSKGSKGKGKDKKSKKSKSDKKSKSGKKSKSSKSDKGKKLSKEEKKELERLRKEQEELEKELRKQAENKMFMFPLKDAVNEEFFMNLFPNFKAKKGGAGKSDKSSKSSKGSKKSKGKKGK